MKASLTPSAAGDFGRTLRFLRHGRNMTLADLAKKSGVSIGYLQNIETGVRRDPGEETCLGLARGLGIDEGTFLDLMLRAQIISALERRGISSDTAAFVWRGIEQRLDEAGVQVTVKLEEIIAGMLAPR